MQKKIIYILVLIVIIFIATATFIILTNNTSTKENTKNIDSSSVTTKPQSFLDTGTFNKIAPELSQVVGKLKKVEQQGDQVYAIFEISKKSDEQKFLVFKPGNSLTVEIFTENDINQIHDQNQKTIDYKNSKDVVSLLKNNINKNLLLNIITESPETSDNSMKTTLNCNKKLATIIEDKDFNTKLNCDPYIWSIGKYE